LERSEVRRRQSCRCSWGWGVKCRAPLAGLLKERWRLLAGVDVATWEDRLDLPGECDHIIRQAQTGEATIVNLGCLVLVALARGDAFIFDLEDKLACVLCRGGERTGFIVQDRGKRWAFAWPYTYVQRRGKVCLVSKEDNHTMELADLGVRELERAVKRYNQQAGTNYHF